MLHPLATPEQFLVLVGALLIAGRLPTRVLPSAGLAFIAGLMAGKGLHLEMAWLAAFWYVPLVAACAAGLAVAAFGHVPPLAGVIAVFLLGFIVAIGIVPDQPTLWGVFEAVAATALSAVILMAIISLPLTRVTSRWGNVMVRVVGAWLAAIAVLNLALLLGSTGGAG